jgi:hypothetical protein
LVGPDYLVNILPFPVAAKGIDWSGKEKTLSIRAVDLNVIGEKGEGFSMKINENEFKDHVLNQTFTIPQKAVMKNGHVYLPIRAISEAYGFLVDYSKSSDMTTISIHQK